MISLARQKTWSFVTICRRCGMSCRRWQNNPEDITKRQLFISTAESFLETSQNVYNQINTYQVSLNTEISDQVDKINEIGEKIAFYNQQIVKIEAAGVENANDYRDARNQLLDELSTYVNFTFQEDEKGGMQVYIEQALLWMAD